MLGSVMTSVINLQRKKDVERKNTNRKKRDNERDERQMQKQMKLLHGFQTLNMYDESIKSYQYKN